MDIVEDDDDDGGADDAAVFGNTEVLAITSKNKEV